jgi:hypothetical protein
VNIGKAFPSAFLKAADLDGDRTLTIDRVTVEEVGTGKEEPAPGAPDDGRAGPARWLAQPRRLCIDVAGEHRDPAVRAEVRA